MVVIRRQAIFALLAAGLAGCAALGPAPGDTAPPDVSLEWSDALRDTLPGIETPVPPLRARITDPQLAALIGTALADNVDVQVARERIVEARAQAGLALAPFRPQLSVSASVAEQQLSENGLLPAGRLPGFDTDLTLYEAGFDASWELALFGRRGAVGDLGALGIVATELELAGAEERLVVEIVRRYVEYQQAAEEAELLAVVIERQQALLEATVRRRDHGEASDFDVELINVQLLAAQARAPGVERSKTVAAYQLAVLTGQAPAALELVRNASADAPWRDGIAADATYSDVLRRRPDVRLAEIRYAQSVRDVDLARLDFYPRLTLFASAGPESTSLSNFTDTTSLATAIGGLVDWALFDGKRRASQRDAAASRQAQASLAYRGAVLTAASEIETAAARLAAATSETARQRAVMIARQRLVDMTRRRFAGGTVPVMTLLEAERDWLDARIALSRLRAQAMIEALALQKSLGII